MTEQEKITRKNWAGNLVYSTENFHQPRTVEEVQEVVQQCDKVRSGAGSRSVLENEAK